MGPGSCTPRGRATGRRSLLFGKLDVLIALSVLLCLSCRGGSDRQAGESGAGEEAVNGGTVVIGLASDPDALNNLVSTDAVATEMMENMLFVPLVRYDEHLRITPALARSWEFSSDHRALTFHLRHDVVWGDGRPTTAHDVAYNYRMWIDPQLAYAGRSGLDLVDSVRVSDDFTITFYFQRPYADQLNDLQMLIMPQHMLADTPPAQMRSSSFNRQPVGNGPFRLKEWVSNQRLEFVPNESYFGERPHLDRVIFRIIPDQTALLTNLETGEIDMMRAIPPKDVQRISKNSRLRVWNIPYRGYVYLGWNMANPLFAEREVRQALTMAIDRQNIVDGLWYGMARICTGPVIPYIEWAYNDDIEPYPHDPERAGRLLASQGWADHDGDGWLDRNGRRFEFELKTNLGNQVREDIAVMVQRDLAEIGIKVIPRVVEWTVFIVQTENKEFDACILAWSEDFIVNPTDIFHSRAIDGKYNMVSYSSPLADSLMDAGRRALDHDQAGVIWRQFQEVMHRDQPYTFLYIPQRINAIHTRIRGVHMDIRGSLINIKDWWIPTGERKY
jgi:peptide/nickel transport system substrate-binding protein